MQIRGNELGDFACVSSNVFTAASGHVRFLDRDRKLVVPESVSDRWPQAKFGFDFTDSYLILQPGEVRSIAISDMPAAVREAGEYSYEITFPYYPCRNVIDRDRLRDRLRVTELVAHGSGKLLSTSGND